MRLRLRANRRHRVFLSYDRRRWANRGLSLLRGPRSRAHWGLDLLADRRKILWADGLSERGCPALEVMIQKAVKPGMMDLERKTPFHAQINRLVIPFGGKA